MEFGHSHPNMYILTGTSLDWYLQYLAPVFSKARRCSARYNNRVSQGHYTSIMSSTLLWLGTQDNKDKILSLKSFFLTSIRHIFTRHKAQQHNFVSIHQIFQASSGCVELLQSPTLEWLLRGYTKRQVLSTRCLTELPSLSSKKFV